MLNHRIFRTKDFGLMLPDNPHVTLNLSPSQPALQSFLLQSSVDSNQVSVPLETLNQLITTLPSSCSSNGNTHI